MYEKQRKQKTTRKINKWRKENLLHGDNAMRTVSNSGNPKAKRRFHSHTISFE
jgi:hypothetical protein